MTLIAWRDAFATGDAGIDHEHMEMIGMINDLHRQMDEKRADRQMVGKYLAAIHDKIASHFALEETEMRNIGYKGLNAHKAEHERLLDAIREIMDGQAKGLYDDVDDRLASNLNDWFFVHFKTMDAALKREMGG